MKRMLVPTSLFAQLQKMRDFPDLQLKTRKADSWKSLEGIEAVEGEVMFLWTYGAGGEESALVELKANPLWSQLDVVKQDQVYEVPEYWIGSGPISANLILDDSFKYLFKYS